MSPIILVYLDRQHVRPRGLGEHPVRVRGTMELLNDAAHRALLFVDVLEKNGAPPTADNVDEMGGAGHLLWGKDVFGYEWWSEEDRETYPDYLSRIGLVTVVDQVVRTTAQGRAMLHHLSSAGAQDELIEMVIDPTDPFAYSKVLTRLAAFGPSMLIDPCTLVFVVCTGSRW